MGHTGSTELITLHEAIALDVERANSLYKKHVNPGLLKAFSILGTANMDIQKAQGVEIHLRDGRVILDFSGAMGVLGLGHNHPRILAAEALCHEVKLIDAIKMAPPKMQAVLAHNLAEMLPDPLQIVFFTVSGAEAVEAAMKLCEKAQGSTKTKFITTTGAYHGKTHGALALTRTESFQDGFLLGVHPDNVVEVPFGDVEALEAAIRGNPSGNANPFIAVIIEPIQGQNVLEAPPGYLRRAAELARRNGILVIFDEVKVGMGRTGTFCAFQCEEVVPDVLTLSKALGGGKRALGAMVTSERLFQKAYGDRKNWAAHTTTLGGLGGTCAVAIETLNIFKEEGIVELARTQGEYLKAKLIELKSRHDGTISELRGRGLFQGLRFTFPPGGGGAAKAADSLAAKFFKTRDSLMIAALVRELYRNHDVLTHFAASDPDVLHIMPPLIVEKRQIDHLVDALDQSLSKGFIRMTAGLLTG